MDETSNKSDAEKALNDLISLKSFDNLWMQLIGMHMYGTNYLSWSKAVVIALQAKYKLGFIEGN